MNWLASAGNTALMRRKQDDEPVDLQALEAEREADLDLPGRDGLHARAHDLGRVGAEVDDHRDQRGLVRLEADADARAARRR